MLLHVSAQNDYYQGARRLCFSKVINIKIVFKWFISVVCDYNIKYQNIPGG